MSRKPRDYTGERFGVVVVVRRDGDRVWCRCDCGMHRWLKIPNVMVHPPKSHSKCVPEMQYELELA